MDEAKEKKVSIIIPCYNVAEYLPNFFKSLLEQTYRNIEVILINDGSKDQTVAVIEQYRPALQKFFNVIFISQENQGLGGAMNAGLRVFSGEYLCWADPDDYLEKRSIENRVHFLEENRDCAIVTSDASIRKNSVDGETMGYMSELFPEDNNKPEQFLPLLKAKSILCAGCHMIRREAFESTHPNREIYPARRGQNWQMLLPVCYKYKRGFLNEPLYRYVVYTSSMSRGDDTLKKEIDRALEHQNILFNTLDRIEMPKRERKQYKKIVKIRIQNVVFDKGIQYSSLAVTRKAFFTLLKNGYTNKRIIVDYAVLFRKAVKGK